MTLTQAAVLRPGDWVRYDGGEHQVIALAGTSVRLRSDNGAESVVLVAYLLASPEFALIDGAPMPSMEPFGLLDGLPVKVLEEAREWERHIMEVETGLPPNSLPGATPRAGFDPANTTIAERDQAKAAELGVSLRTVKARRARYARQSLWGLVDQRAVRLSEATGRADARLVAAIRQVVDAETDTSTGTRSRLIRRVVKAVEATYGPGVVPLPGRSTFYKVIDAVSSGRHTFGSAVTRRQTANRPQGLFTPTHAARPGEQVQIDSTPIDVLVLLDNGVPVRADLTIAVDVATRTICAAVLRPVGTKAVDAALLLAKMLVPEPMRPSWSAALRMSASRLPHARLVDIDTRMELAAARPVIVPDTIVIDGGKVFVSDTFTRACGRLGVSVQRAACDEPGAKRMPVGKRFTLEGDNVAAMVLHTGRPARMDSHDSAAGSAAAQIRELDLRGGVGAPIVVDGRLWGAASVGSSRPEPLPPDTEARVGDFTDLVATAIANAETHAELTASRARIVAAADDTRRRIERDLHDGAQQRLVSLGLEMRTAEASVPPELHSVKEQISHLVEGLAGVSEDLQEISRGIHPAILSRGGLGAALKTLARRSAVPVELDVGVDRGLPGSVEVAAYYVVAEALTNAAKHAQASEVAVRVEAEGANLH